VRDCETGLLVPPGNVPALAQALRQLVDDAELRHAMGAAARRRIEQSGSVDAYGRALTTLIREVARG